jgi:hypothetical protein
MPAIKCVLDQHVVGSTSGCADRLALFCCCVPGHYLFAQLIMEPLAPIVIPASPGLNEPVEQQLLQVKQQLIAERQRNAYLAKEVEKMKQQAVEISAAVEAEEVSTSLNFENTAKYHNHSVLES